MRFLELAAPCSCKSGLQPIHRLPVSLLLLLPSLPLRKRALRMPVPLRLVLLPPARDLHVCCRGRAKGSGRQGPTSTS